MRLRLLSTLVALVLVLAACGGDSSDDEPQLTTTSAAQEPTESDSDATTTTTTAAPAPEEPAATGEEGTGTATIGDMTWEFTMSGGSFTPMCDLDVSGVLFLVLLSGTDDTGREITMNISGPLSGDDDLVVQVGSATLEFERWTADRSVYDRLSGIEGMPEGVGATVQIDGDTVSGSGVFYDDATLTQVRPTGGPYDAGVLEGTFSATCPAG